MRSFMSPKYSELEAYTPGEQPQDMKYVKLNTNESPFPPSDKVLEAVAEEVYRCFVEDTGAVGEEVDEFISFEKAKKNIFAKIIKFL